MKKHFFSGKMSHKQIVRHNRKAWDDEVALGFSDWTKPVSHEEIEKARNGYVKIFLTPTKPVPPSWFPPLTGCRTLCLASGGGQQGPILAAAGALVTVFDNSPRQLESDKKVAEREDLDIKTVLGDMTNLSVFPDESFDLIVHPVSNVFVPRVLPVWKEAARVLKKGGILLSGFTNPVAYMFDGVEMCQNKLVVAHRIPYSPFNEDAIEETRIFLEYGAALEFGHTLEDQIGGQLKAGFVITGMYEDNNRINSRYILDDYIPIYIATQAVKTGPDWPVIRVGL